MVASLFGASQVEVLAQGVEQGRPRRHVHLFLCAVNSEYDSSRRGQRRRRRPNGFVFGFVLHVNSSRSEVGFCISATTGGPRVPPRHFSPSYTSRTRPRPANGAETGTA